MTEIPKIRFRGFTDDWEQHKVKNVAPLQRGFDLPAAQMEDGEYPVVMSNGIGGYHSKFKVKGPGVITGRSGTIGRLHYIEGNYWPHNTSLWVTDFKGNYPKFIYYLYQKLDLSRFGSGSGVPTLNRNDVHDALVEIPQICEQQEIAEWFDHLDHLITLHKRKCDDMIELKKYMLQKMFPQNGKKIPEIRFAGFTDDWEQHKLREFCSRVQGNDGRMELPTLTISAGNGWMRQEDRFSSNIAGKEQKNYTLLRKGELSYNHGNSKLAKYGTVFSLRTYEEALVPRVYHSFKVIKGNADFIEYYFATKLPDKELGKLISSGVRMDGLLNIGYDEFMGISLMFPPMAEQTRIATYFRSLDHLITLHQRKLDELKEVKKYMLQNMFPQKG